MSEEQVRYLSQLDVLFIHDDTMDEEGGMRGIRDLGALASAVDMPQSGFGGVLFHSDLAAKAAAYLYHICENHAFIDGNKRTAAFSALLFLTINGIPDDDLPDREALEVVTLEVASKKMTKPEVASFIRSCIDK